MQGDGKKTVDDKDLTSMLSLKHWGEPPAGSDTGAARSERSIDCGWGRLIFGQTFDDPKALVETIRREKSGQRDVAMYARDPNVVLSYAPQDLFLDPSLTFRLKFKHYQPSNSQLKGVVIRPLQFKDDDEAINRIYMHHHMVPAYDGFYAKVIGSDVITILVAVEEDSADILGIVTGVDHTLAIDDPDNGSSLWALAVDPQCARAGVGEALVRALVEMYIGRGRQFMDLSVMHDNDHAIRLYKRLEFEQVPAYCIKNKNPINETLFIGPEHEEGLNVYAQIIIDAARRRGIAADVLDAPGGFFRLSLGGRSVTCRESLSELTSAVAMSRCDDKSVTRRILHKEGIRVPEQAVASDPDTIAAFLDRHRRVVVKPARGEQGRGIKVDVSDPQELEIAIEEARAFSNTVLLEEFVRGDDLRIVVIDNAVVAAAVRRPAQVKGDGQTPIRDLIEQQSKRRQAATQGESKIPLDSECERCVRLAGYEMGDILPDGIKIRVRKTANLHTGGTIHDVTDRLHPVLARAAVKAAMALEIPVVGMDFMVPDVEGSDYVVIEANERPGLANHEPQPTAERFIDLLFPHSRTKKDRRPA
ncbi:MAG: N-acetylglutaminylglutamine synthetase [Magnetospiraceae bacterium]